jgi:hypothetical protein
MRLHDLVETRVRCPSCAEKILAAARKCKHCGEFVRGHDEAPPPTEPADLTPDDAGDGDARESDSRISPPLLAALVLLAGGGAIVLGAMTVGAHRPAAEPPPQAVVPAKPADAAPPAAQPTVDTCDTPEVLESIARGLQGVQHLPERSVPRERFVDLKTIARTDHSLECGVTLAAGPRSDDIRAGYYHVEYRSPGERDDDRGVASNPNTTGATAQ